MTREALEQRIAELKEVLRQIENNGNATLGAISECERWLQIIEQEEAVNDGRSDRDPD